MADAKPRDKVKKQIPLRVSATLYDELARWAEDEFRSINGQIEYLLTECVKQRKKSFTNQEDQICSFWVSYARFAQCIQVSYMREFHKYFENTKKYIAFPDETCYNNIRRSGTRFQAGCFRLEIGNLRLLAPDNWQGVFISSRRGDRHSQIEMPARADMFVQKGSGN